jgi:methylated-DNA-[protein]-cysteine S-methyltransferase
MPYARFQTSLGVCEVAWTGDVVIGFSLPAAEENSFWLRGSNTDAGNLDESPPVWIADLIVRAMRHLGGASEDFGDVPFDFSRVTSFQREVYLAALGVKAGDTRTYGWLAEQTGRGARASRAVGGALGRNPWPLLVPCHRFIGASGKMTGFSASGGVVMKRKLLAIEGAELLAEG